MPGLKGESSFKSDDDGAGVEAFLHDNVADVGAEDFLGDADAGTGVEAVLHNANAGAGAEAVLHDAWLSRSRHVSYGVESLKCCLRSNILESYLADSPAAQKCS